jgi:hypothetical protein
MRTSFLIVFNDAFASRKDVCDHLDKIGPDWDWHAALPHCVFFNSSMSAYELADSFEQRFGTGSGKMFLISQVGATNQGRLSDRGWRVLNNPDNPRGK